MIYISKEGEVISTENQLGKVIELYDSWKTGKEEFEINTSGSTGTPKTITLHREAILASIKMTAKVFNLTPGDFFLCNLNTDYIGGKMMVLRAAELYCDIMVIEPSSNPFLDLEKHKYLFAQNWGKNLFSFVPLQLAELLQNEQHVQLLRTARAILVGGAAVSQEVRRKVKELNLSVFETYGMTETISHIAIKDLREDADFFTALEGVSLATDDSNCLKIKSPSTLDQWITTNDVVELLSENTFILKGRRDNIINSGGVKIQLEDVERAIAQNLPEIGNFFAFALEDESLGQKLVLAIEGSEINLENAFENLPKYHKPKDVFYLDEFAKTESGKINKLKTIENLRA
jgi:O-succinylbenzoic acid--CoA ligase